MTPELIHRQFIDAVQGRIQLRQDSIELSVYGFKQQRAVEALLTNSSEKLERANLTPASRGWATYN
jgi:hypothetical protein